MTLVLEPVEPATIDGVRLLGIESTHRHPAWPTLRHVFDVGHDAALHVEIGPYLQLEAYAVGFDSYGDELLTPL